MDPAGAVLLFGCVADAGAFTASYRRAAATCDPRNERLTAQRPGGAWRPRTVLVASTLAYASAWASRRP